MTGLELETLIDRAVNSGSIRAVCDLADAALALAEERKKLLAAHERLKAEVASLRVTNVVGAEILRLAGIPPRRVPEADEQPESAAWADGYSSRLTPPRRSSKAMTDQEKAARIRAAQTEIGELWGELRSAGFLCFVSCDEWKECPALGGDYDPGIVYEFTFRRDRVVEAEVVL